MTKRKFLWLVEKHYDLLLRAAARRTEGTSVLAEDSVQEVITRLLERKSYLRATGANGRLRSWLFRIVVNQAIDAKRLKSGFDLGMVHGATEVHGEVTPYVGTRMFYPSDPQTRDGDSAGGPPCAMPKRVRNDPDPVNFDVTRALAKLNKRDRYMAEGCLMGHDTPASMAEALGEDEEDVKMWLTVIKHFLAAELASYKVGKP